MESWTELKSSDLVQVSVKLNKTSFVSFSCILYWHLGYHWVFGSHIAKILQRLKVLPVGIGIYNLPHCVSLWV